LDVLNNYTVVEHVKQILDDFVVSAVSSQNCAGKCAKSQVLFLPTTSGQTKHFSEKYGAAVKWRNKSIYFIDTEIYT